LNFSYQLSKNPLISKTALSMTMQNIFCTVSEKSVFYQDKALGSKHSFREYKKYFGNIDFW